MKAQSINNVFYTAQDMLNRYSISTSSLRRWVENGEIPKPYTFGKGKVRRWKVEEVHEFEIKRKAA